MGEIVEMGRAVQGYKVGERVSAEGHIVCGVCRACRAGKRHLCPNTRGIGVNRDGCFAEYVSVPSYNAWHVHDSIPDEIASIFDPYGNATHTALSFDMVGEDVTHHRSRPHRLHGSGHSPARGRPQRRGHRRQRLPPGPGTEARRHPDGQRGEGKSQGCPEGAGHGGRLRRGTGDVRLAAAFEQMLENMYNGGRIALLGLLPNGAGIDWDKVIFKGLFIKGIYGREMFETWYKMQTMVLSGLDISPVITHRFAFDDFEKGFDDMLSGQSGKVVLSF